MERKMVGFALLALLAAPMGARAAEPLPTLMVVRSVPLRTPGSYLFRFSLWNTPTGPGQVFAEQKEIPLRAPTLTHRLGSVDPSGNPLPLEAFAEQLYLMVEYRGPGGKWQRLGTREMLTIAPYAISALLTASPGSGGPSGKDGQPGEQGPPGPAGSPGASCWDQDENSRCDLPAEDRNGDETCTVADCRGPQGMPGGLSLACVGGETLIWRDGGWNCRLLPPEGCAPGDLKPCYEGAAATLNVGRCRSGISACGEDRTWGPCTQQVLPAPGEICEPGIAGFGPRVAALFDDDCAGDWNEENAAGCVQVYPDADGDGIGATEGDRCFCGPTASLPVTTTGDCNDGDPGVAGAGTLYYRDLDADGYRDCAEIPKALCAPAAPYTASVHTLCDCDDSVAATPESPSSRGYTAVVKGKDADHDGWGDCAAPLGWFCPGNDYVASGETSNTIDPEDPRCDCDDADPEVMTPQPYCLDADGDGFMPEQVAVGNGVRLCAPKPPFSMLCEYSRPLDCDDSDPNQVGQLFCPDFDGDGYRKGDSGGGCMRLCAPIAPFNLTEQAPIDCDDGDPARFLYGLWFRDADGDGFGSTPAFQGCSSDALQVGEVRNSKDCDDSIADPSKVSTRWCTDFDGDGFHGSCPPGDSCEGHGVYVLPSTAPADCNDNDPGVTTCP